MGHWRDTVGGKPTELFARALACFWLGDPHQAVRQWCNAWSDIFGTLFERGLDPAKRTQLGPHYTDSATIERLTDPVIRRPLLLEWDRVAGTIAALMAKSRKRGEQPTRLRILGGESPPSVICPDLDV